MKSPVSWLLVLCALALPPAISASADDGHWEPLPGFEGPFPQYPSAVCWHEGELYIVAIDDYGSEHPREPIKPFLFVRRDGRWVRLRELERNGHWRLVSNGRELYATQGAIIHRLTGERWRRFVAPRYVPATQVLWWNGHLLALGDAGTVGEGGRPQLSVWDGESWQGFGGRFGGVPVPRVNVMAAAADGLWVAGAFKLAGGKPAGCIARWDGMDWDDVEGGVDGEVSALCDLGEGMAVAGLFTHAGSVPCDGIAFHDAGGWRALPPLPMATAYTGAGVCPVPSVRRLTVDGGSLLALGTFTFVDDRGDTVRDVSLLDDGRWRRWERAAEVVPMSAFAPVQLADCGAGTWPGFRRLAQIHDVVIEQARAALIGVDLEGLSAIAVLDDAVTWPLGAAAFPVGGLGLASWRGDLLLLGAAYVGERRMGGLARWENSGWAPIGDWLGPDGRSGGWVQSAVTWRDQLVVAGLLDDVAGRAAGCVEAWDGDAWRSLGDLSLDETTRRESPRLQLIPRDADLLLAGTTHVMHQPDRTRLWRWDGVTWTEVPAPPGSGNSWSLQQHAVNGDTLWVSAWEPEPDADRVFPRTHVVLSALIGSEWSRLRGGGLDQLSGLFVLKGRLHATRSVFRGCATRLARWNGTAWVDSIAPDLPADAGRPLALPSLTDVQVFWGSTRSLVWDGSDGWARWPGADGGWGQPNVVIAGPLCSLEPREQHRVKVWTGTLPAPDAHTRPEAPDLSPLKSGTHVTRPDLPSLAACAPGDTLCGWRVASDGSRDEPPRVTAHGDRGVDMARGGGTLLFGFRAAEPCWFRLTGRAKSANPAHELRVRLAADHHEARRSYHVSPVQVDEAAGDGDRQRFDLLIALDEGGRHGQLIVNGDRADLHLRDLRLEVDPGLFAAALDEMCRSTQARRRPAADGTVPSPMVLSPLLREAARNAFTRTVADSLAVRMILDTKDPRLWIDGEVHGLPDSLELRLRYRQPRVRRYGSPPATVPCEHLPALVDDWLDGDLAYVACGARRGIEIDSRAQAPGPGVPLVRTVQAAGLVLDLREPDSARAGREQRVLDALCRLGAGQMRWARAREVSGQAGPWRSAGQAPGMPAWALERVSDLPIVVLISGESDGYHALLAEALSRLDNVTLIGETTAPLPPRDVPIAAPWGGWSLMVPGDAWEAPDGRVLTDSRVEPDVEWPAADTAGLVANAQEIVARFRRRIRN